MTVAKRATSSDLRRWGTALGVGSTAGGAGTYAATKKKKDSGAVVAGGLAGQGLYQAAGYATTGHVRARTGQSLKRSELTAINTGTRARGKLREDLSDKKGWEARMNSRRKHTAAHTADGKTNWAGAYRTWPKDQPYYKATRVIGHTHNGKSGMALGAAATIGGAILGGSKAHGRKQGVAKLYVRDQKTSLPRVLETGAGLALGAWGLGRSGMLGAALGRGIKSATRSGNSNAIAALQIAQAAQGVLRRGTAPAERTMRQIRSIDRAIDRVPSAIRPEIALAAGTLLVGTHPIRRDTYHPVNIRIRTGGF